MATMSSIKKVIVVDDSALVRAVLSEILNADPRLHVVACAADPYEARTLVKQHNPDVLTLDIEMPKMNGISFLKNIMRLRPMPVVMISTLTQKGAPATLQALEIGAVDFLAKPTNESPAALHEYANIIVEKVLSAASANVQAGLENKEQPSGILPVPKAGRLRSGWLCAIGASTGGTEAIKQVISVLPEASPAIVIAQHIPENFSKSFAKRLNDHSCLRVYEAEHQQKIEMGCVYVAPGHSHLSVKREGSALLCNLNKGDLVNRHRPSVDVLFDSVVEALGRNAIGVLLTGMGSDGAKGLLRMREAECDTVAQDESSSVVWGMPGTAVKLNAARKILALPKIADYILSSAYK